MEPPAAPAVELLTCRIAGAWYRDVDAATARAIARGTTLALVREPRNLHDPDAVAVHTRDGVHLGYVPRRQVPVLARLLDAGERLDACVTWVEVRDRAAGRDEGPRRPGVVVELGFAVRWIR